MKIDVACGGTGGHIFPGLATARVMQAHGHDVLLWLSGREVETVSVEGWQGPVQRVHASGFPNGLSLRAVPVAFRMGVAVLQSLAYMRRRRPDVLLAMGSYASVGPALAAQQLRVPYVLHEANAVAGRAVSFLANGAAAVGLTFAATAKFFSGVRTAATGLPLRLEVTGEGPRLDLPENVFTLLVMGGSQGAHRLNEVAVETVCSLAGRGVELQVMHLTGRHDETWVADRYRAARVEHRVYGFLREMGAAYRSASLAVARAGAASCMELAACGVPTLFVPLPTAQRDHQTANARAMESAGGADVVAEKDFSPAWLGDYVERLLRQPEELARMREAMVSLRATHAAERLADLVESCARPEKRR